MISTSLDQLISLARKWREENTRIRLISSMHNLALATECSVISVSREEIGLLVSGQPRSVASIRLSECTFFFGPDDVPPSELQCSGLDFDAGISIITSLSESVWLLEILDPIA